MPTAELVAMALVALYAAGTAAIDGFRRHRSTQRKRLWRESASEAGLEVVPDDGSETVTAMAGPLRVRFSEGWRSAGHATKLEIDGRGLAPGLTLRPEPPGAPPASQRPKEIEVGDEEFDREVSIEGLSVVALAVLDARTRQAVRTLLRGPFEARGGWPVWITGELVDGRLEVVVPSRTPGLRRGPGHHEPEQAGSVYLDGEYRLPRVLRAVLDLADRLVVTGELPARLSANLTHEPLAGVRRRLIQTLVWDYPEDAATREAVMGSRDDEDAVVRLRAGIALGRKGHDILLGLAGGEGAEDGTSARAAKELGASLSLETASDLLRRALRTRRGQTAAVCLGLLGDHGEPAVPMLARVLLVEKGDLGMAAAAALATTGSTAAEEPLVRALSEGAPDVSRAAAAALGTVGSRDAVLPLREAEARGGALAGDARQAVAEIQARLAGAAHGQLSLAGGEAGQLSLTEDEGGRLSLSDDDTEPPGERSA